MQNSKIEYMQNGQYYVPKLELDDNDEQPLGKYGRLRKAYLQDHRKPLYIALSIKGELFRHCAEIEALAHTRLENVMASQIKDAGITEDLKSSDPVRWARLMNTIKAQAEEYILHEILYR